MKSRMVGQRRLLALLVVFLGLCAAALAQVYRGDAEPGWYTQSAGEFATGNTAAAAERLSKGIASGSHFAPAFELLADCYMGMRQFPQALAALQGLHSIYPTRPHVMTRMAEACLAAEPLYLLQQSREAVIQEPRSPRARMLLAYSLACVGVGKDALVEAKAAAQLAHSPEIDQSLRTADKLEGSPTKLSQLLRPFIFRLAYE